MGERESRLVLDLAEVSGRWKTLSLYERFEQLVISALTLLIAAIVSVATWQLILHVFQLLKTHVINLGDPQTFQSKFGMVLTVLIALEFKHSLLVVRHHRRDVVQVRSVVLIALLALVRRFIIFDFYQASPGVIAALAGAALALGIVFWIVGNSPQGGEH